MRIVSPKERCIHYLRLVYVARARFVGSGFVDPQPIAANLTSLTVQAFTHQPSM